MRPTFLLHRSPLVCCELDRVSVFPIPVIVLKSFCFFKLWKVDSFNSVMQLLRGLGVRTCAESRNTGDCQLLSLQHLRLVTLPDLAASLASNSFRLLLIPDLKFFLLAPLVKEVTEADFFLIFSSLAAANCCQHSC